MEYVVEIMRILCQYFPNADEPLDYSKVEDVSVNANAINSVVGLDTIACLQNYDTFSQYIGDMNQGDVWTYNDELPSQPQTNSLATTTINLPIQQQSRDEIESSIREFSRLWPSRTQNVQSSRHLPNDDNNDSRNLTIASNDMKNDNSGNYLKRNGALVSGGVPLPPLILETEPNVWDLPSSTVEIENRKYCN